ncbi:MAG: amidohydrolase [Clostridiales bacterium]|nr:amidohydrolase [Clostridiales bacterium]
MLIFNANVHSMDKKVIENGFVRIEGGKVAALGPMEDCPPVAPGDVDAQGGQLYPGWVDTHCHLGLLADGQTYDQDDCNEESDPVTPHLRAIDALYPLDNCFKEAREGGVTTVLTGPGSANAIGGQFAAVKTAGRWIDDMVVKAPVAMKFALGENPKGAYGEKKESPMTRMATAALIRENLALAAEYLRKKRAAAEDEDKDPPDFDAKLEALAPVLEKKLPAHFHAHRADDIATAVRIAKEFDLDYVIIHGTEGHLVADLLAAEGARVVTGPIIGDRSKPELSRQTLGNTAALAKAGVKVAICTDHPENPVQYLPLAAAITAKNGLDTEQALRAISIDAAEIAGIADRVGSITPGKDADLVLYSGHPFDLQSKIMGVWIDGVRVKE